MGLRGAGVVSRDVGGGVLRGRGRGWLGVPRVGGRVCQEVGGGPGKWGGSREAGGKRLVWGPESEGRGPGKWGFREAVGGQHQGSAGAPQAA